MLDQCDQCHGSIIAIWWWWWWVLGEMNTDHDVIMNEMIY